ncbi:MAG: YMGG-like glycine zipper-containing protein [Sulfurimonas sp.]
MKTIILKSLIIVASIMMLNNCTGNEAMPNNATQTGAATGAVAGGVIGYNAGSRHKGRNALIGATVGAVAGGAVGNAIDKNNPPPQEDGGWQ